MQAIRVVGAMIIVASGAFCSNLASAATAPYVSAIGGIIFPKDIRSDAGITGDLKNGYAGTAAVGATFGPVRAEIEGSYRRSNVGGASGFGLELPATGHASALSAMVNAYFDPDFRLGPLKPYVGGGVGVSRFRASDIAAVGLPSGGPVTTFGPISGDRTGLAWQVMAGVGVDVSTNASVTVGYRYFATPGVTVDDVPLFGPVRLDGLKIHAVEAGLRFAF